MKKIIMLCLTMVCLLGTTIAQAAQNYSGVVTDEKGNKLFGATLAVENTTKGTVTDIDGKFSIDAESGGKLIVSYLGFKTQTVPLAAKTALTITLSQDGVEMEEVVVTGYVSQKRSDISTAVASINMDEAVKNGSSQILEAMQGQISGVQINQDDGSPSGAMTFRIRGTNSLTGGTQPLFVIDGVPQPVVEYGEDEDGGTNPLAGINMDDVASVEILKDAAAAAIYGSDGSNGVVLITTKQGEAGKAKFNVAVRAGYNIATEMPLDMQTPEEYARRMYAKNSSNASWQNIVDNQLWNYSDKYTDWVDELVQNSMRTDVSASMSGGSDQTTYMLSLGYQNNEGLMITNTFQRLSGRLNLTQKVGKNGKVTGMFNYSSTEETNPQQDGLYLKAITTDPYWGKRQVLDTENIDTDDYQYRDPVVNLKNGLTEKVNHDVSGQLRYEHKIGKDFTLMLGGSGQKKFYDYTQVMGENTTTGRNYNGQITIKDNMTSNWMMLTQLRYNKRIKKHHTIQAFAAYEMKQTTNEMGTMIGRSFDNLDLEQYSIATALDVVTPTLYFQQYQSLSLLGRVSYNYKDRYLINGSLRRDGSSKFGNNNKYATFPSASVAWRVEQEQFMQRFKRLSSLKVRASYGVTGNNQIPVNLSQALMSTGYVGMGDNMENTATQSSLANNDLKWESSREYNAGFDLSLFKNRLSLTADYYNKTISDMLLETPLPTTSGFSSVWQNAGKLRNKGFEFAVNARILEVKDFSWSTNFNISFNRTEVLALADGQYEQYYNSGSGFGNDVLLRVGMSTGIYYGYVVDGVYNTEEELASSPADSNKALGYTRIVDTNNDGQITEDDRVPIANVTPDHYGGWGHTLKYKNWELYAFFRWSYGNDQINANLKSTGDVGSNFNNVLQPLWESSYSDTNPFGTYKTGYVVNDPYASLLTSNYVEDGSFIRFQTLRLGYSFPKKITSKLHLGRLNCNFTASNIALWTKYTGLDVEANNGSGTAKKIAPLLDRSSYPRPLTLQLSVDVGF